MVSQVSVRVLIPSKMQEMQNTLRGLRNHADTLKNVNNPEAQAAYGRATDAINKIESALKGYGI